MTFAKRVTCATLLGVALTACDPEPSPPAVYVAPALLDHAHAWSDAADLDAQIVAADAPDGPGLWLRVAARSEWAPYLPDACSVREGASHGPASMTWAALTFGVAANAERRVGTAAPPDGVPPIARLDPDQARAVRLEWRELERACEPGAVPW